MKLYTDITSTDQVHTNQVFARNNDSFYVEITPLDKQNYSASADNINVGPLLAVRIQCKASVVTRKVACNSKHQHQNKRYSFFYVFKGKMVISYNLGTNRLKENDFVLLDNMSDRTFFVNNDVSFIVISVDAADMSQYLPRPGEVVGQQLSAQSYQDMFFFNSLLSLWEQIKEGLLSKEITQTLANELLSNIAQNYACCYRNRVTKNTRRMQEVKTLVGENLCNPELSVEMIARSMDVCSRYLRSLFTGEEKLSHYILRRRLEECAMQLENPLYSNLPITSIAFRMGFNSTAHFSRSFKQKYNMTPREYRKSRLEHNLA